MAVGESGSNLGVEVVSVIQIEASAPIAVATLTALPTYVLTFEGE
jgi:hypothetical protein